MNFSCAAFLHIFIIQILFLLIIVSPTLTLSSSSSPPPSLSSSPPAPSPSPQAAHCPEPTNSIPRIEGESFKPPDSSKYINDNEVLIVNFTISLVVNKSSSELPIVISKVPQIAKLLQQHVELLQFKNEEIDKDRGNCGLVETYSGSFTVEGDLLGVGLFDIVLDSQIVKSYTLFVLRKETPLEWVFRIVLSILLILMTFTMGNELDFKVILGYMKRPIAPAIGFLSQYLIMPLTAFALSQFMPIDKSAGFGLLTVGCSPGGGGSNMWTILFDGDLNLSMTMTFLSSVAAYAMMPLWMYLLGGYFVDSSNISIPYGGIAGSMSMTVIPVFLGMAVRWKRPLLADKFTRLTRPMVLIFLIFMLTVGTYVNWSVYRLLFSMPLLLAAGAPLPALGFLLGGLFAFILRQGRKQVIAISLETGIQNIGIAILILLYTIPQPYGSIGAIIPLSVALFTPLPLLLALIILKIKQRFCYPAQKYEVPKTNADEVDMPLNAINEDLDDIKNV